MGIVEDQQFWTLRSQQLDACREIDFKLIADAQGDSRKYGSNGVACAAILGKSGSESEATGRTYRSDTVRDQCRCTSAQDDAFDWHFHTLCQRAPQGM